MKARPILFSGPMVRALLTGTKTQTRRVAKGAVLDWLDSGLTPAFCADPSNHLCPYGGPGDLLIVRETTQFPGEFDHLKPTDIPDRGRNRVAYVADGLQPGYGKQRPAIHMPRWASRLTLEITEVRVERLQEIDDGDSMAEGIGLARGIGWCIDGEAESYTTARLAYRGLWERINGAESWRANPWVWAVSFKVHQQNVDAFLRDRVAA